MKTSDAMVPTASFLFKEMSWTVERCRELRDQMQPGEARYQRADDSWNK